MAKLKRKLFLAGLFVFDPIRWNRHRKLRRDYLKPNVMKRIFELMEIKDGDELWIETLKHVPGIASYYGSTKEIQLGVTQFKAILEHHPWVTNTFYNIMCHELCHHKQFMDGKLASLSLFTNTRTWCGKLYNAAPDRLFYECNEHAYMDLPWEKEANLISDRVVRQLIAENLIKQEHYPRCTAVEMYEHITLTKNLKEDEYYEEIRKAEEGCELPDDGRFQVDPVRCDGPEITKDVARSGRVRRERKIPKWGNQGKGKAHEGKKSYG
jgi:hypothetical protein